MGALLGALIALGCADPPPKGPALTLSTHPHVADRYARLLLRELVDSNPIAVRGEVLCEQLRLYDALGNDEGQLRMLGVEDSIYRAPSNRARFDKLEQLYQGRAFEAMGPRCDSLTKVADRVDPIAPVDSATKNR